MCDLGNILFGTPVDRTAIWTAVLTLVTLSAVLVAWRQLSGLKGVSQADFAFRFIESFFTSDTRTLFTLLMNSGVIFEILEISDENDRLPCLKIKANVAQQLSGFLLLPKDKIGYTAQEVDDFLLGQLEILGRYVRDGLISYDIAYSTFGYYVKKTYENEEIKKYLDDADNKDTYIYIHDLYNKFRDYPIGIA